jgi:hypothetical protein
MHVNSPQAGVSVFGTSPHSGLSKYVAGPVTAPFIAESVE